MTLIQILENRAEALNVQQVAEILGVSDKHIYGLAAQGKLPAFRVGKAIRFDPTDVADWSAGKKGQMSRKQATAKSRVAPSQLEIDRKVLHEITSGAKESIHWSPFWQSILR
jgi:putative molybdopterin biosynthesis protein